MKKTDRKKDEPNPRLITVKPLEVTPVGDLTGFEAVMDDAMPRQKKRKEP